MSQQPTTSIPVTASSTLVGAGVSAAVGGATVGTIDAIVGIDVGDENVQAVALLTNFNMIGRNWTLNITTENVSVVSL